MKILYQIPSLETVYAARFIYEGYKAAFIEMGHEFRPLTSNDNFKEVLENYKPDIFISSLNNYYLKYIDLDLLKIYRERGLVFFNQIQGWKKLTNQYGGGELESQKNLVSLIKKGLAGDIFFHWLEQDDPIMDGFEKETHNKFHTILLAANPKMYFYDYNEKYSSDVSYVGSYIPDKRDFIKERLIPLKEKYNKVNFYGSDWTSLDRLAGIVQKIGQYFNIDPLKKIRRIKLSLDDERKVYSSSIVSLNIHENHQRKYGGDFNERTFKIIACGGFEICDNVKVLRKYFSPKELVIGNSKEDWFEKIDYYIRNPEKRIPIINAGLKKVLEKHTYIQRAEQFIDIYKRYKNIQQ